MQLQQHLGRSGTHGLLARLLQLAQHGDMCVYQGDTYCGAMCAVLRQAHDQYAQQALCVEGLIVAVT